MPVKIIADNRVEIQEELLKLIRSTVEKRGWTIVQACAEMEISRVYWYRMISENHLPSLDWLFDAALKLGLSVNVAIKP